MSAYSVYLVLTDNLQQTFGWLDKETLIKKKVVVHKMVLTLFFQCFHIYLCEELVRSYYQAWLNTHPQTFRERCFEKYCSCDKACQFYALKGIIWQSYLEKLIICNKYINKRIWLSIHQMKCLKITREGEKILVVVFLHKSVKFTHLQMYK